VKTIKKGDRVIAPFAFSDGTFEYCHAAMDGREPIKAMIMS
jgi:threonine dehydrogenase-like Zn-dependent dehydrogenase